MAETKATGICPKCQRIEVQLFPVNNDDFILRKGKSLDVDYHSKKIARMICGQCVRG
jgi:hypothetical protein